MLDRLGEPHFEIRQARDLEKPLDRLIIPGGESTVMRRLLHDLDLFETVLRINLVGTFTVLALAAERMAATDPVDDDGQRGLIVNTASGAAIKGVPDAAPYNAVKGGVAALTRGMAVDFGKYNIRVNCVCPGDILTPMLISEGLQTGKITTGDPKTPEEQAAFDAFIASCGDYRPLQRIGTAEQIAYTFLFLASDMSYYATGGSFVVDGGRCS